MKTFKDYLQEQTQKTYTKQRVLSMVSSEFDFDETTMNELEVQLDELNSVELLNNKFSKADILVALNRTLSTTGAGTSTFQDGLGRNYTSQSKLKKDITDWVNKL